MPGESGARAIFRTRKHGIRSADAERLINRVGNNREKLDAEAEKLKKVS